MKSVLFFVDHMKTCETSFWIDWICSELNLNGIIATDGLVHSSFRKSSLMFMSKREGFKISRDCVCISFSDHGFDDLIACLSVSKILYVNCMNFLYETLGSSKHGFLEKIACSNDKVDIYIPSNSYIQYIKDYKGVASAWDKKRWEIIIKEENLKFKEKYYGKC